VSFIHSRVSYLASYSRAMELLLILLLINYYFRTNSDRKKIKSQLKAR